MFISMHLLILLILGGAIVVLLALRFIRRDSRTKECSRCAAPARNGYSRAAESKLKDIEALCISCLSAQLEQDYSAFGGRVIVVQPIREAPCYVFRDRKYLREASGAQDLDREVQTLLDRIKQCNDCGSEAHCLWIASLGLDGETVAAAMSCGLERTLLAERNQQPISLCGKCAAKRISESIREEDLSYIEVCSPHGNDEGMVIPMGY